MRRMVDNGKSETEVCLALGSNLGDRLALLRAAREALAPYVRVTASSSVYETVPAYISDQPLFLNAVLRGFTKLDPIGLLYTVKDIEIELGRRPTFRYGPRVIDIDIIFYGQTKMATPELTIPHALMAERVFVLKPLADIAPEWVHPVLGQTVQTLLEALPDVDTAVKTNEVF